MMSETFVKPTAEHLAAVIHAIRDDWDERGILAALGKLRTKPLWQVVIAAALAAHNPSARTPEVIALQGDHWRDLRTATTSPADRHPSLVPLNELCDICSRERHQCEQLDNGHDYRPRTLHKRIGTYEAGALKARAALAAALPQTTDNAEEAN